MTTQSLPSEASNGFKISAAEPATIAIESVRRDDALVCRARGISAATVREYADAMKAGAVFPPVVAFRDAKGVVWLADGFHRCGAAELAGLTEIAADVREGGRREALLHAASANAAHGLRRTNADKRRAVELVLGVYPKKSDRWIADACGVSPTSVGKVRGQLSNLDTDEREGADGKTRLAPAFDTERETARAEKMIAGLASRWPADQRSRFCELVMASLARARDEVTTTGVRTRLRGSQATTAESRA